MKSLAKQRAVITNYDKRSNLQALLTSSHNSNFTEMVRIFLLGFLVTFLVAAFFVLKEHVPIANRAIAIVSPLPDYLQNSALVTGLDFWKPKDTNVMSSTIEKPQITAVAAYVYDITTDKVLYEKNSKEHFSIASLVKITTAIVALESKDAQSKITVSEHAASVGENSMGVSSGETYTLEELLYGLVLHSGNDAAEAIAEAVSGDSSQFVDLMNQKAQILGLSDTHFVNPSGLEEDNGAREYSSGYDLAVLTKYALTLPVFAKVAATVEYDIPYSAEHKHIYLFNQTNLLTSYPGVKGVKTGYTPSAGLCLVTYVENGGHKLIGVILNSERRREEMRELLDYSFSILGVKVP